VGVPGRTVASATQQCASIVAGRAATPIGRWALGSARREHANITAICDRHTPESGQLAGAVMNAAPPGPTSRLK
jgi:hypothetical protein